MFAGHVIEGGALSSTTIVCTQLDELPQSSEANHVRVIVLSCGQPPAAVTSLNVKLGVPSQLSVADGDPVFTGSVLAVHKIVMFAGHAMTGALLSSTNMI